jgi:hypothetical protein
VLEVVALGLRKIWSTMVHARLTPVYGNVNISQEELKQMGAATRERNHLYQIEYQRELRRNTSESYKHRQKVNNVKQKPGTKARQQNAFQKGRYERETCGVGCRDMATLVIHDAFECYGRRVDEGPDAYKCGGNNR